jgi:hypothetical protein
MPQETFEIQCSCCSRCDEPHGSPWPLDCVRSLRFAHHPGLAARAHFVRVLTSSGMDRAASPFQSRPCLLVSPSYAGGNGRGRAFDPSRVTQGPQRAVRRARTAANPGRSNARGLSQSRQRFICNSFLTHYVPPSRSGSHSWAASHSSALVRLLHSLHWTRPIGSTALSVVAQLVQKKPQRASPWGSV